MQAMTTKGARAGNEAPDDGPEPGEMRVVATDNGDTPADGEEQPKEERR